MKLSQLLTAALAIAILCLAFTRIKINNQKSDIEFMSQIVMLKLDRDCNVFDSIEIDLNPNNSNHQMLAALYVIRCWQAHDESLSSPAVKQQAISYSVILLDILDCELPEDFFETTSKMMVHFRLIMSDEQRESLSDFLQQVKSKKQSHRFPSLLRTKEKTRIRCQVPLIDLTR